mgnify:FL=1
MPSLDQLQPGQIARVDSITGSPALIQRVMEMGLLEGEVVEVIGFAPLGDPMEIQLCGYRLSLRCAEAQGIQVTLHSS